MTDDDSYMYLFIHVSRILGSAMAQWRRVYLEIERLRIRASPAWTRKGHINDVRKDSAAMKVVWQKMTATYLYI